MQLLIVNFIIMRNVRFYFILGFVSIILISCYRNDEDKFWERSLLIGKWEQTGGDNFVACPDGDNKWIQFTETEYTMAFTDNNGCATISTITTDYTFDGKTVSSDFVTYGISNLTETTFEASITEVGLGGGNVVFTKISE